MGCGSRPCARAKPLAARYITHSKFNRAGKAAPVILIIVGAIAAINIAEMLLELVREYYYGGVLIDTRVTPTLITNEPKIPADTLVVISKDNSHAKFRKTDISTGFVSSILGKL
jgi:hypothetical protein